MSDTNQRWWTVQWGPGPILATAIHDGHDLRPGVAAAVSLGDQERLREEDPFTGESVRDVATHVIAHRSRFEFDLNRAPDVAVYRTTEESWGLELWKPDHPSDAMVEQSRAIHGEYYRMLGNLLDSIADRHDRFCLIDVHSYNHRRDGPEGDAMAPDKAPEINIGTFSMPRDTWAFLLDPLMEEMRRFDFNGRTLDVRENIAFQGKGYQTAFVHERYPDKGCAIALEFKKFYMDEWTGQPIEAEVAAMRRLIAHIADTAKTILER